MLIDCLLSRALCTHREIWSRFWPFFLSRGFSSIEKTKRSAESSISSFFKKAFQLKILLVKTIVQFWKILKFFSKKSGFLDFNVFYNDKENDNVKSAYKCQKLPRNIGDNDFMARWCITVLLGVAFSVFLPLFVMGERKTYLLFFSFVPPSIALISSRKSCK